MNPLTQEELLLVREILLDLDKKYPEVLYDGILRDADVSDATFSALQARLEALTLVAKEIEL